MYAFLADLTAFLHLVYVGFVVIGQLLIMVGLVLRWSWVRNMWFRVIHLSMILIVVLEEAQGVRCPLTDWQDELSILAGVESGEGDFIATNVNDLLFPAGDESIDHTWFTIGYVSFGVIVLATLVIGPPRLTMRLSALLGWTHLVMGLLFLTLIKPWFGGLLLAESVLFFLIDRHTAASSSLPTNEPAETAITA